MKPQSFVKIVQILIVLIILIALYFLITQTEIPEPTPTPQPEPEPPLCEDCYQGKITKIIDGDTLEIDNTTHIVRIRLALTDTPDYDQEAKEFTTNTCPVGSTALVDEDEGQPEGSFGRTIALIYCSNTNLNEALLVNGHAVIDKEYCNISEFKNENWAKRYGC